MHDQQHQIFSPTLNIFIGRTNEYYKTMLPLNIKQNEYSLMLQYIV